MEYQDDDHADHGHLNLIRSDPGPGYPWTSWARVTSWESELGRRGWDAENIRSQTKWRLGLDHHHGPI